MEKKIFTYEIKHQIAKLCQENNKKDIIQILENFMSNVDYEIKTNSNEYNIIKFVNWLKYGGKLPYNVIVKGNGKLPFLNFSTLPIVTCAGSGSCEDYCYSLKAWRQAAPFFRQCMNTLLMHDFNIIEKEFIKKINNRSWKNMQKIDFRLYVDGDFSSKKDLENWMNLLKNNSRINAYGYSKSLNLFLDLYDQKFNFPGNYVLNLSNGGIYDSLKKFLLPLNFVRGNFTAVKGSTNKEIRSQFKNKIFICPGTCGTCTKIGHACGNNDVFQDMEIVIGIH